MKIAIIPARGGSKRIPRKNIRDFNGRPMFAWSVEAARASGCFDRIIVSTDDEEISAAAVEWGAEVPFQRPAEFSTDTIGTAEVVGHAIEVLAKQGCLATHVCCIYATAPLLQPTDLSIGLEMLLDGDLDFAVSVTSFPFPIQRAVRVTPNGQMAMFWPENEFVRSQDLEEAFHDAGQFYWGTAQAWLEGRSVFGGKAAPVRLPRYRVQDIDTEEDWERAALIFRLLPSADQARK